MNSPPYKNPGNGIVIKVVELCKTYSNGQGEIPVLRGVNFQVRQGEMVAVTGPSGSGKSTLLYILGLLLPPTRGGYWLGGEDVLKLDRNAQAAFRRQRVGFVFQGCDLLESSTVYENLEFPLIYAGVNPKERPGRIIPAIEKVRLGHRLYHAAKHLSGGERQRVAVARALVNCPDVILADEPTGQLDRAHGHLIMDHFTEICHDGHTSVVLVTHDPEMATRCTHIYPLRDGVLYDPEK